MSSHPTLLTGRCACGRTTWSSTALPTSITYCHCTTCRLISGSACLPFGDFPVASIRWHSSAPQSTPSHSTPQPNTPLKTFNLDGTAERGKCAECGSPLFMRYYCEPHTVGVCMGTMDVESVRGEMVRPTAHIFTSQKVPWFEVGADGLVGYERHRPGFQEVLEGGVAGRKT